nr:uncharacterized mitochondrial protein AtMg00810-like [Tanacetum cinerariifolium]
MSSTVPPPILPSFETSTSNTSSPNANRVDTMPLTNDPNNTTNTTNVSQSVVDENLPQLLDSRGGSHVTNVPTFDKEDFTSWKVRNHQGHAFMEISEDEPLVGKADARSGQWVDITMKKDEISDLKKVIDKWTYIKVTLDQLLSEQVLGNIVKALGGKGRRNEKISSKEVVFNKANKFSLVLAPESPLTQKNLISLSDLTPNMADLTLDSSVSKKTRPSIKMSPTYVIKKKTKKSNVVLKPFSDKKVDSFTKQLLLTLMDKAPMIPKPFKEYKYYGFNDHHSDHYEFYPGGEVCGSIAHEPYDCPKRHPNSRRDQGLPTGNQNPLKNSGCSRHMTRIRQYLHRYSKESGPKVVFRDDFSRDTKGYGSVNCNGITFTRVAYVNGLKHNLINISLLCDANYKVLFSKTQETIYNQNDKVVLIAPKRRDVYVIDMSSFNKESNTYFFAKASLSVDWLWHKKLSYLNFKNINNLAKHNLVSGLLSLTFSENKNCSACEKGKHHKKKSNAADCMMSFIRKMENLNEVKVKELRSDNGTEFRNHKLEEFCDEKCISHNFSSPCTPEQNGVAERRNKKTLWIIARGDESLILCMERIDYEETCAPVARLEAIRIFLAYASYMGFMVYQMDVKSAFLNGKISKEVYVQQPPGFESSEFPNRVYKLDKALYGLKQDPEHGFDLKAYSDSDYAGCNLDRKSTLGGCQILGGKLVCWTAKKQSSVAMSSAEVEYVAAAGCCAQVLWIKSQLAYYDVLFDNVPIFCDNTSAIAISNNPVLHSRTKHIDISICTALTKEPFAMCIEYLKDFWYIAEVDDATKDILFSLSLFENRLSFTCNDFLSTIVLTDSETDVSLPYKGSVRAREENICYTRFLSMVFEKLMCDNYHNDSLIVLKPHHISATSFQTPSASKVNLTSHILKVAKLSKKPEESLILPFEEVNAEEFVDKSQSRTNVQPLSQHKASTGKRPRKEKTPSSTQPMVLQSSKSILTSSPPTTHLRHAEELVVIADANKSLNASKSAETQGNQPNTTDAKKKEIIREHSLDIPKDDEPKPESPFDTELEIKFIKSFQASTISDSHNMHSKDDPAFATNVLTKEVKFEMGQPMTSKVRFGMQEVKDNLTSQRKYLGKYCLNVQRGKNKKDKDANPAATQEEHQPAEIILSFEPIVKNEVDLDKQPLSKRFKIMTPIPNIQNPIPLKTIVLEHLLKPKEQQKSVREFTNQLFGTTSSNFSLTHPKEPTPPRDSAKGKKIAVVEEQVNNLFHIKKNEAKKLGLHPPLVLTTFGMIAEDKKRKRTEILKEYFVTENNTVYEMHRNLIPPFRVMPIEGLVINEPESGIFFMNGNTDIAFQREIEFHLTPTTQLIRIQNQIKANSEIAGEMYTKMVYRVKKDSLSAKYQRDLQSYSSQRHRQRSRRLLEDILVSWDGYQLAAKLAGWLPTKEGEYLKAGHVGFGPVLGDDGKRFGTCSTEVVNLVNLLDEIKSRCKEAIVKPGIWLYVVLSIRGGKWASNLCLDTFWGVGDIPLYMCSIHTLEHVQFFRDLEAQIVLEKDEEQKLGLHLLRFAEVK